MLLVRLRPIFAVVAAVATFVTFALLVVAPPVLSPLVWMAMAAGCAITSVAALWWTERQKAINLEDAADSAGKRAEQVRRLGELLSEGSELRHGAWEVLSAGDVAVGGQDGAIARQIDQRAQEWRDRVVAYLDEIRPGWSAIFLSETWSGMQAAVDTLRIRSSVGNWYERRLAKLGDLVLRLEQ